MTTVLNHRPPFIKMVTIHCVVVMSPHVRTLVHTTKTLQVLHCEHTSHSLWLMSVQKHDS